MPGVADVLESFPSLVCGGRARFLSGPESLLKWTEDIRSCYTSGRQDGADWSHPCGWPCTSVSIRGANFGGGIGGGGVFLRQVE
jgi:hypothetical protein